jgi:GT2 family glycosyltransferase
VTGRPRASIIIVAYGRRDVTEACLASLDAALGDAIGDTWELVLVDNASPDDTLELLRAWGDVATVVALTENRNFSGGCNAGAAAASGEVLVFLNNDTVVGPGALEALVDQATEPGVGAVGPRLLYPDGTIQHAGVWMMREATGRVVPYHLFHHEPGDLPQAAVITDLDCVTGACLVVPAARFDALNGFDETYVNGWEDVDLCLRIRSAGDRIVYRGDVVIVHDEGATRGRQQGYSDNATVFYARWGTLLEDDLPAFRQIWGAGYGPPEPAPPSPADIVVDGVVSGLGPAAAHARAVIAALEVVGRAPAAADPTFITVCPRLTLDEWAHVQRAHGRVADADVPHLDPREIATPVQPGPIGAGGGGVLLLLPAHDLELAASLITLARATNLPLHITPTARTALVQQLVAATAPGAELLDPTSSEMMLAAYARGADVVIAADPADRWDRQALICAGAGASVIVREDGPAAALLGPLAAVVGQPIADMGARAREQRAAAVREACAPEHVLAGFAAAVAAGT